MGYVGKELATKLYDVYTKEEIDTDRYTKTEVDTSLATVASTADTNAQSYASTAESNAIQANRGFKNYIINGNFDVWQRGTSFTATGYSSDRWIAQVAGTCTHSQETTDVPVGSAIAYKWLAGAVSSYGQIRQFIETATVKNLRGKEVTISSMVKTGGGFSGNIIYEIYYSTTTDSSSGFNGTAVSQTTTGTSGSTWSKITSTFTVPTNAVGLYIGLVPTDVQTSGAYALHAQVQLEEGSVATPFEQRPYGLELSLCQRYYYAESNVHYNVGFVFNSTQVAVNVIKLPVAMRVVPTITPINPFHITTEGNWGIYGATNGWISTGYTPFFESTNQYIAPMFSGVSGVTNGASYICNGWFSASAEL